jgi:hypothetical protein
MRVLLAEFYSVDLVRAHPTWLFVFGDNDLKKGKQGQAVIRDEPNAFGIPTKKIPSLALDAFYQDEEYQDNVRKIDSKFEELMEVSRNFEAVCFPKAGLGTGLAKLDTKAPKTFLYLKKKVSETVKALSLS